MSNGWQCVGRLGCVVAFLAVGVGACARHETDAGGPPVTMGSIKDDLPVRVAPPHRRAKVALDDGPRVLPPVRERVTVAKVMLKPEPIAPAPRAAPAPEPMVTMAPERPRPEPPAKAPVQPPPVIDAEAASRLLAEGKALLDDGKVVEARIRFLAAAEGPLPEVLLALARSYDTYYLSRLPASNAPPDLRHALVLYERAAERGALEAAMDAARVRSDLRLPPK
jgi:hypothetical protein